MTLTSRSKGTILSKPSQTGQHHRSEGCCASLGQGGKDLLKVRAQTFHSCSPGIRATSGAGGRNWPRKHRPCSTHFKGIKDASLRESWKVAKARHCVSGFGETLENYWMGQFPRNRLTHHFRIFQLINPSFAIKRSVQPSERKILPSRCCVVLTTQSMFYLKDFLWVELFSLYVNELNHMNLNS